MGFMAREGLNYTLRPDFGGIPNSVVDSPIQDHSGRHGVNFAVCIWGNSEQILKKFYSEINQSTTQILIRWLIFFHRYLRLIFGLCALFFQLRQARFFKVSYFEYYWCIFY